MVAHSTFTLDRAKYGLCVANTFGATTSIASKTPVYLYTSYSLFAGLEMEVVYCVEVLDVFSEVQGHVAGESV